ncbi:MAG: hypothetical protein WBC18_23205 [Ottowia sp.]|uniref:hypothetical protein n=1 Tax=Ottowia sp. TaxID=1898956 RepID=UPI003C72A56B
MVAPTNARRDNNPTSNAASESIQGLPVEQQSPYNSPEIKQKRFNASNATLVQLLWNLDNADLPFPYRQQEK